MILDTADKMYKYFLSEIRKERTIVVPPQRWVEVVNEACIDWTKLKLPEMEFNQKRIDDLEAIKVVTDSLQYPYINSLYPYNEDLAPSGGNIFAIPYDNDDYAKYMHGISVEFGININPPAPGGNGGDETTRSIPVVPIIDNPIPEKIKEELSSLVAGKIFRSDTRVVYKNNPYRIPDDNTYVYFEQRGNYIYVISKGKRFDRMSLEYYRYPTEINLDGQNGNVGSFKPTQNKEIVDLAVTNYLERVSSPRIQTQPAVRSQIPK